MYRQGLLLNTVMMTCLAAVAAGPLQRFAPQWQPLYLVGAVGLIALEAGLVHYTYRRDRMWTSELLRYLAPELLLMVVLMRVATILSSGTATLSQSLRRWLFDPLSVFDLTFIVAIIAGLVVGTITHSTMQALRDLQPQEFEGPAKPSDDQRLLSLMSEDRAIALRTISNRFIAGGVFVLLALGLESVNIQRINEPGRSISTLSAIGALVYLMSGFLLYSQARLALLQSRWRLDGARVAPNVGKRWTRSSWLVIVGVALVMVVLPRTYGLGLLDTIRAALGLVGYLFSVLGYAVIWFFSLVALIPALLLSFFRVDGPSAAAPPITPPPPPPPPTVVREPQLFPALVFWACMLLLVIYAIMTILQRHPLLVEKLFFHGPVGRLLSWLRELWRDTRGWVETTAKVVQQRLQRPPVIQTRRGPLIRLGALSPRDLVRYFYRSTLRRAASGGLPRRAGQTPREYGAQLAEAIPEAEQDIAALTESFVAAQYSRQTIGGEEARRVRGPWQRLRGKLRVLGGEQQPQQDEQRAE